MKTRRARGLTLLELAIAMAVIVILAALALPNMGARLERQRVQGAAEALAADLAEARFEAARRSVPLFVEATAGAEWCWAIATRAGCPCGDAQGSACALHGALAKEHKGVRLVEGLSVRMDPSGTAQAAQAAAMETSRGDRLRVEVAATGRSRVCVERGHWPRLPACG